TFLLPYPQPPHISTLSLHDALPISLICLIRASIFFLSPCPSTMVVLSLSIVTRLARPRSVSLTFSSLSPRSSEIACPPVRTAMRSEEHTSELQSRFDLVCRLLLEKK